MIVTYLTDKCHCSKVIATSQKTLPTHSLVYLFFYSMMNFIILVCFSIKFFCYKKMLYHKSWIYFSCRAKTKLFLWTYFCCCRRLWTCLCSGDQRTVRPPHQRTALSDEHIWTCKQSWFWSLGKIKLCSTLNQLNVKYYPTSNIRSVKMDCRMRRPWN